MTKNEVHCSRAMFFEVKSFDIFEELKTIVDKHGFLNFPVQKEFEDGTKYINFYFEIKNFNLALAANKEVLKTLGFDSTIWNADFTKTLD